MQFVMTVPTDSIHRLAYSLNGDKDAASETAAYLSSLVCRQLMDACVTQNRILMRLAKMHRKPLPALYESRVIYRREESRPQRMDNVLTVYGRGYGDCKHLVCIRLAELAEAGREAHPLIYWRYDAEGLPFIFHAELRHGPRNGRGQREDPSRYLGM